MQENVWFLVVHLPDVTGMAANQLNNFARVADGTVGEQKEQARVSAEHGLPQDPAEWLQDVGPSHVCSDFPNILTSQSQCLLKKG